MGWECAVCGSRLDDSSLICRICGYQKDTEKLLHLRCPTCQREYTFGVGMKPFFCECCGADFTHVLSYARDPEYQVCIYPLHQKHAQEIVLRKNDLPYELLLNDELSLRIQHQGGEWSIESQMPLYVNGSPQDLCAKIPVGLTHLRAENTVLRIALTEVKTS